MGTGEPLRRAADARVRTGPAARRTAPRSRCRTAPRSDPGRRPALAGAGERRGEPALGVGLEQRDPQPRIGRRGRSGSAHRGCTDDGAAPKPAPGASRWASSSAARSSSTVAQPTARTPGATSGRAITRPAPCPAPGRRSSRTRAVRTARWPRDCRRTPRGGPTRCRHRPRRAGRVAVTSRPNPRPRARSTVPIDER